MVFKFISKTLKKAFKNLFFLMFLNGFLLASLFYFKMESSYEEGLFLSIKAGIDNKIDSNDTQDSIVVKAMRACNFLMANRSDMFSNNSLGLEADLLHPTSVDLMTTRGACGSYSTVLARILQAYHYPIRIAQMKANGYFGAHNLVEVKTANSGWVILDPTFNLAFVRPDARLASFNDVKNNWAYYSKQTPPDYDQHYRYEDVRYSDWEKIPVILPAIKGILTFFMGAEKVNEMSIRVFFLKIYSIYFYISLILYIPIFLLTMRRFVKTQIFPDQNIPLTFRNLIKYIKPHFTGSSFKRIQSF
jgi:transglutaminase superfamily protein